MQRTAAESNISERAVHSGKIFKSKTERTTASNDQYIKLIFIRHSSIFIQSMKSSEQKRLEKLKLTSQHFQLFLTSNMDQTIPTFHWWTLIQSAAHRLINILTLHVESESLYNKKLLIKA